MPKSCLWGECHSVLLKGSFDAPVPSSAETGTRHTEASSASNDRMSLGWEGGGTEWERQDWQHSCLDIFYHPSNFQFPFSLWQNSWHRTKKTHRENKGFLWDKRMHIPLLSRVLCNCPTTLIRELSCHVFKVGFHCQS